MLIERFQSGNPIPILANYRQRIDEWAAVSVRRKSAKISRPSAASSLLSPCPQLAACLGRRPAPGNLCSGTYADLAAAGHRLCPRMWALGRCYEGGEDRGMLQKKKDRRPVVAFWPSLKETSVGPQKVAYKKKNQVQCRCWSGGSEWVLLCRKVISEGVVNGCNAIQIVGGCFLLLDGWFGQADDGWRRGGSANKHGWNVAEVSGYESRGEKRE